ncbi:MAG: PQQ-binding-like beta-propeller repeat protein [Planctomycetes bacterium]|nr:PQQ-binding-like beta-propeller repeat protein [Planctomycetota bacterium]
MRLAPIFALVLIVSLSPCFAKSAPEWPQWMGPNRDGKSPDTGLLKEWPEGGPPLVWKASGIGKGYSSVAVARGMVYITGDIGDDLVITAFDMEGNEKWKVKHGRAWPGENRTFPGSRATPTISSGRLYLLSTHGLLGCYDAKRGKKKWTLDILKAFGKDKPPGYGYCESVLVDKKLIYLTPGGKNCIVALSKSNGKTVWISKGLSDGAAYSSCVPITYKRVPMILQVTSRGMVCISAKNGQFFWRCDRVKGEARAVCSTPVYHDGYCFAASGYGNGGACVKLSVKRGKVTGEQIWDTKDMVNHHGGYIIHEGHIYGNHAEGWSCLDLKTGEKKWFVKGVGKGSLCYADGMLYLFGERDGRVGLLPATPEEPQLKGEFKVEGEGKSWAHPVVIGGRLYIRYDDNLYVYDVTASE